MADKAKKQPDRSSDFDFNVARAGWHREALRRIRNGADPVTARKAPKKMTESLLTFKEFLRILDEDTEQDVVQIQGQIAQLDAIMNRKIAAETAQKQRLIKQLALKQKQREQELKMEPGSDKQQGLVKTPGSSGASTPGSS